MYIQVKRELGRRNKKQQWLCEQTGIPNSHMSEFMSGKRSFRHDKLNKIANALGMQWELVESIQENI